MTALVMWWRRLRASGRHRDDRGASRLVNAAIHAPDEATALARYNEAFDEVNALVNDGFNRLGPPPGWKPDTKENVR